MKRSLIFLAGFLLPLALVAQIRVSGTVQDATGEGLPGASVTQKGTSKATVTDLNGAFTLDVSDERAVLSVSFIGFATQEVTVGTRRVFNITLEESASEMEEVVVIGYGTQRKGDVTGALVSVSEKSITSRPVQNVVQALQGKAAGVDIVSNIRPGEISSVTIRGQRSMYATNAPLYVVDGVVFMGTLNDISPNDIEAVSILKDASATAIYGSRGANGVILITTKTGNKGKVEISYDGSVSFDNINSLTEWATAGEALERYRQGYINANAYKDGAGTYYTTPTLAADLSMFGNGDAAVIAAITAGYAGGSYDPSKVPTTDWVDLLTRTGITQNHQVSLNTGNDLSKLYVSFGHYDNQGTQLNQGYTRNTFKVNGEITPRKWVTAGISMNMANGVQDYGTINRSGSATGAKDLYGMALSQIIMAQPYDANGDFIKYPGGNSTTPLYNPMIDIDESADQRNTTNIQTNLFGEIRFTPWLKYRINYGLFLNNYTRGSWQSSQSTLRRYSTTFAGAAASYETSKSKQWLVENILNFDKTFASIHTVSATLMQSAQKNVREGSTLSASKILTDASKWYDLSSNTVGSPDGYGTSYVGSQILSYMGRLNYSLLDRYILTATIRFDGASVLASGNKWASFPSLAAAWKMQEESFLSDVSWLNELKLRAGYGQTGNAAIEPYTSTGPLSVYDYVFGTSPAVSFLPYLMSNPTVTWERTAQSNIGLDFGLLNNRIAGSIDLYDSNTSGLLMERTLPAILGYPFIVDNIGKSRNRGIEVSLSTRNIVNRDFTWNTDLSFAHNKEELVELVNGKEDMKGNGWYIGYPQRVFRTYKVDGLWQDTPEDLAEIALWTANGYKFAPGQYKPVEQGTPDHKLTDDDKVIIGTDRPDFTAGMTNTFTYKGFELSCFIYARVGQMYFSSLQPGGSTGGQYVGYVRKADLNEFWSPTNKNAEWPGLTSTPAAVSTTDVNQAMYINDGSFVTVRNISLGYTVPEKVLKPFSISRLQLYTQVLNPFMWGGKCVQNGINPDDTNGWTSVNSIGDPTGGTNNNTMMITSFVLGCRIGF